MKIAQVITRSDTLGGASAHVRDLTQVLRDEGHEVCVFVGGAGPIIELFRAKGICVKSVSYLVREVSVFKDVKAFFQLSQMLKVYAPDIIACHSAKAGLIGRLAAWRLKIPVVYTAHGWPFTKGVPKLRAHVYRLVEKLMANKTSQIITVSKYDRDLALSRNVSHVSKLNVILNGVPDEPDSYKDKSVGKVDTKPLNILMVARFQRPKNFQLLLESLLLVDHKNWILHLVGDGPDLASIKMLSKQLGIEQKVAFLGWRNDVAALLQQADIFTLISDWEGLPLSILEAMRMGLPVIGSDVGGVKEALTHKECGLLVSNNNKHGIADAFQLLLSDSDLRNTMGRNGRARYEAHFSDINMARQTLVVYQKAINGN
jgi:glycosyltransferase involved in cell wall biosynthesis